MRTMPVILAIGVVLTITLVYADNVSGEHRLGGKTADETFDQPRLAALARAACVGDVGEVDREIKSGADPNGTGSAGFTPLFWAVDCSNIQGMEALLKAGANPNYRETGTLGSTPVMFAASSSNPEVLKLLLKYGGNPNASFGDESRSALMNAFDYGAQSDNWANYYMLLDGGGDIRRVYGGMTITELAASLRRYEKVAKLLDRGYDYDLKSLAQDVQNDRFLFLSNEETLWRSKVKSLLEQRGVHFPIPPKVVALVTMAADGTLRVEWRGGQKPSGGIVTPWTQYIKTGEPGYEAVVARAGELKPYGTIGGIPFTPGDPIPVPSQKPLRD